MKNISMWLMGIGAGAFTIGELIGAFRKEADDTFSEWFKRQPKIVQFAIIFFAGAVFSHFSEWRIRDAVEAAQEAK
jgi:hypothetical protein